MKTTKFYIRISVILLGLFMAGSSLAASPYYVSDPTQCLADAFSQSCVGGLKVCGVNGSSVISCYDTATFTAPGSPTSVSSGTATASGGYYVDCYSYDAAAPYCNNNGAFSCLQNSTCNGLQKVTTCTASQWANSTCGACKTGYNDCDGNSANGCSGATEHDGVACTTSLSLPGTYQNCVCVGTVLKLGADSLSGNSVIQGGAASMIFVNGLNVGIGTSLPNDIFSIGNSGVAPAGSSNTGHNFTSTYLSTDDYALTNYGIVKSLIGTATGTILSLWGGTLNGNIWNGAAGAGNVGIGTTAPISKLDVNGTLRAFGAGNLGRITAQDTNGGGAGITLNPQFSTGVPGIETNGAFPITFNINSLERMRITSGGNLGIGTSTPLSNLQVGGLTSVSTSTPITLSLGGTYSSTAGANPKLKLYDSAGSIYGLGISSSQFDFVVPTGAGFAWYVNASEKMRLNTNGNLGIGTTVPNDIFSIGNAGAAPSGSSATGHNYTSTYLSSDDYALANYGIVKTLIGTAALWGGTKNGAIYNGDAGLGNVGIGTTNPSNKLTVFGNADVTGNLIIGATTVTGAGEKLSVKNAVTTGSFLMAFFNGSSNGAYFAQTGSTVNYGSYGAPLNSTVFAADYTSGGSYGPLVLAAGGLSRLTVLNGGNVGIGTTAPNDIFSIGNSGSAPAGSSKTGHNYTSTYLSSDDYALTNYGIVKTLIGSATGSLTTLWGGTMGGNIWNLNSTNVGIGTTNPMSSLNLLNNAGPAYLTITQPGNYDTGLTFTGTIGDPAQIRSRIKVNSSGSTIFSVNDGESSYSDMLRLDYMGGVIVKQGDDSIFTAQDNQGIPVFKIISGGNVGIGTIVPNDSLSIGNAGAAPAGSSATGHNFTSTYLSIDDYALANVGYVNSLLAAATSSGAWILGGNNVSALENLGTKNSYPLPFITNGVERMRLTDNGNLVIGAASTAVRLHVESPQGPVAFFSSRLNGGTYAGYLGNGQTLSSEEFGLYYALNDARLAVYDVNSASLVYGNGIFINNNSNNVGIGTLSANDNFSIGNGTSAAPAGSGSTGHNFTSTYLSSDDYALVNYGMVRTLIETTAGTAGWNLGGNSVTQTETLGTLTNHPLPFIVNNSEVMRLQSNGSVSIGGGTSTTVRLHVETPQGAVALFTSKLNGGLYSGYLGNGATFSGEEFGLYDALSDTRLAAYDYQNSLLLYGGGIAINNSSNNVGIGITNPLASLHVASKAMVNPSPGGPYTFNPTSETGPTGTIQQWTVPKTGTYLIRAWGAEGGATIDYFKSGGKGARITGEVYLTAGEVIDILVGQKGGDAGQEGMGGGGTFVVKQSGTTPIMIAGGGGGACENGPGMDGVSGTTSSADGSGTCVGNPGPNGGTACGGASGGGGFTGDGGPGVAGFPGLSYINGATGGASYAGVYGGFGGGGGTHAYGWGGGGGGGYAGGSTFDFPYSGGGGSSYNSGLNQANSDGIRTGAGLVIISWVEQTINGGISAIFDGNVGINTTAPNDLLSIGIGGNAAPAGSDSTGHNYTSTYLNSDDYALVNYGMVKTLLQSSGGGTGWGLGGNSVTQTETLGTLTNHPLPFIVNNSEVMRLQSNGSVSIGGGTSTTVRLHVETPQGAVALFTSKLNGGLYSGYLGNGATFSGEEFGLYNTLSDTRLAVYDYQNSLLLYGGGIAINNSSNNVGIGITNPLARLHVASQSIINTSPGGPYTFNPTNETGPTGDIQHWTVPKTGDYTIEAYGAEGGAATQSSYIGGKGAKMTGTVSLVAGEVIDILVGQKGGSIDYDGMGGGGTFIVKQSGTIPLVIAGGGGGASFSGNSGSVGMDAVTGTTSTADSADLCPGVSGPNGGQACSNASGGGGFTGDGEPGSGYFQGLSYTNGATGGASYYGVYGGFGGGGGTHGFGWGGGGGGGYAGGSVATNPNGGGGGSSYNIGTNQNNTAGARTGAGLVTITWVEQSVSGGISAIFDGNVGIGTTMPNDLLSIGNSGNSAPAGSDSTGHNYTNTYLNSDDYALVNYGMVKTLLQSSGGGAGWNLGGNSVTQTETFGTLTNHPLPFIVNNSEVMRLQANGSVSIGGGNSTTVRLHVETSQGPVALFTSKLNGGLYSGYLGNGATFSGEEFGLYNTLSDTRLAVYDYQNSLLLYGGGIAINNSSNNVGIGTTVPNDVLSIGNGGGSAPAGSSATGHNYTSTYLNDDDYALVNYGVVKTLISSATSTITGGGLWGGTSISDVWNLNSGNVGIGTTNPGAFKLKVAGDVAITGALLTQTGSDFAEEFKAPTALEPGTVVVMGDEGYKSVKACEDSYDKTVVGIVSDNPSIIAGRTDIDNKNPEKVIVAMMGVVKVKVTNANGKITKGDLLTTSDFKGYAMRAKNHKQGTVIGKALEDLNNKTGEIKVLVNLQ